MKKFDIEEQWKLYLQLSGLEISAMPLDQIRECFRAFLAGITQLYMFIYSDLQELTEEQAMEALSAIEQQVSMLLHNETEYEKITKFAPVFPADRKDYTIQS